jgi:NhaP-type Na+/H+ or K+/H+ antiporter
MVPLAFFVLLVFFFSLVSRRLEGTIVTAPIVFTGLGMLMFSVLPWIQRAGFNATIFRRVAEIGLVLLLFTDASRTELGILRSIGSLPARLLSIGLLLSIALGTVVGRLVFPQLSVWEAGILAAILAPTDAGLGQVIVNSPRVPMRIREALNVEAGLNDGLSVPFLLFFMALAAARIEGSAVSLMQFIVEQLGYGVLVGLAVGIGGGWLIGAARRKEWIAESFQQIGVVALALLGLAVSEIVGASMFIASFVAGLAVQVGFRDAGKHSVEFAEEWGQLFNFSVFFIFGALVVRDWPQFSMPSWLYALLSLTVARQHSRRPSSLRSSTQAAADAARRSSCQAATTLSATLS